MSSLKVYCSELENNPHCIHGPTLLFSRQVKGKERKFYACSAYRDRKDCNFFFWADEKISQLKVTQWKNKELEATSNIIHSQIYSKFKQFQLLPLKDRQFCQTCFEFVFPDVGKLHKNHILTKKISDKILTFPSALIKPITSSKKEAQFWFTNSTKEFIINSLKSFGLQTCLCIGVPTVHELLRQTEIKTLLLDIDKRYHYFYSEKEYCWFNMFNNYFFANIDMCQNTLKSFLSSSSIGVIIDPPFGARIEPLANTINKLQQQATSELNILLILPYFMEPNVIKYFPNFVMLDYQLQYTNHKKFQNNIEYKKKSSPVRIFTNISPALIQMPGAEGYYYCKNCKCWRCKNNRHCDFCKTCPSKNGEPYVHCSRCGKCVKKSWNHCAKCNRCVIPAHDCYVNDKNKQPNIFLHSNKKQKISK